LGALLKFIKKALKHRVSNVELRRAQKEVERQQRQAIIEENLAIESEKMKVLETYRSNLPPEELENFNEADWLKGYDEEHLKHVPPEIADDLDRDM
jgi:hypothetical protein